MLLSSLKDGGFLSRKRDGRNKLTLKKVPVSLEYMEGTMRKAVFTLFGWAIILSAFATVHKAAEYLTPFESDNKIAVSGNIMYVVVDFCSVHAVDVQNPASPILLSTYTIPQETSRIWAFGSLVCLLHRPSMTSTYIYLIDYSDPSHPTQRTECSVDAPIYDIDFQGDVAFIACGDSGFRIINFAIPNFMDPIYTDDSIDSAQKVQVEGDRVYVGRGDNSYCNSVTIYDISYILDPDRIANYTFNTRVCSSFFQVSGSQLFTVLEDGTIQVYQFLQPQAPTLVTSLDYDCSPKKIFLSGNTLFCCRRTHNGIFGFNVSDLLNPVCIFVYQIQSPNGSYAVGDGFLACEFTSNRIDIIDISEPDNPYLLSVYPDLSSTISYDNLLAYMQDSRYIVCLSINDPTSVCIIDSIPRLTGQFTVKDNIIYTMASDIPLIIRDISDPDNVVLLAQITDGGTQGRSISFDGSTAVLCEYEVWVTGYENEEYNSYFRIIDLSNLSSPQLLGRVSFPGRTPSDFPSNIISNNYLYILGRFDDLVIFDISDPMNPVQVGGIDLGSSVQSMQLYGSTMYVIDPRRGVMKVDVSDPSNPVLLDTIIPNSSSYLGTCCLEGNLLFIEDEAWNEIIVYDLSSPQPPEVVCQYYGNYRCDDIFVQNSSVFVSNYSSGLYVLDLYGILPTSDSASLPAQSFAISNYPNPFNPSTTISYSLPQDGRVELAIYNVKGQRIRTLISEAQVAGTHNVVWDGTDSRGNKVASGLYLYRVSSGNHSATGKALIMK
jgi:hypothetical protein